MKRYQIYLHPQSVEIIDRFQKETDMTRSAVIRLAVDALAHNLAMVLTTKEVDTVPGGLDEIVGLLTPKDQKTTNLAERVDEIYLHD